MRCRTAIRGMPQYITLWAAHRCSPHGWLEPGLVCPIGCMHHFYEEA